MSSIATLPPLTSLGQALSTDETQFGFIEPSNHLLDDPPALRARLEEHGYLYMKNFLDRDDVLRARRSILSRLEKSAILNPDFDLMEGRIHPDLIEHDTDGRLRSKTSNFRPDLATANAEVEAVVYGPELQAFYDGLFGEPALHFDFTWLRFIGPGHGTSAHCDLVYMSRGSHDLLTCWVPYGEIPLEVGGLIILEKSHLQSERIKGYLDKDVDDYCQNDPEQVRKVKEEGGWSIPGYLSKRPDTLPEKFGARWLTCECWEPGDFITFNMTLVHGSLDNCTDRIRISTDVRYQPASQPADERWIGANPPGHGTAGKRGRIC
jgi:ectoine hydroxylase-related dioxygenase (phytanoyl-CoA dioxygenase family)